MKRAAMVSLLVFLGLICSTSSEAKTNREFTYSYNQIWGTIIRFLRVDNGFEIIEKDKDEGYILFEYHDGNAKRQSSFELVTVEIERRIYIRAGLNIENMPSYIEVMLQDKLRHKLKIEYGDPPSAKQVENKANAEPVKEEKTDDEEDTDQNLNNEKAAASTKNSKEVE